MHSQAKTHLPGLIFFLFFSLCTIGNGASEFMFLSGTPGDVFWFALWRMCGWIYYPLAHMLSHMWFAFMRNRNGHQKSQDSIALEIKKMHVVLISSNCGNNLHLGWKANWLKCIALKNKRGLSLFFPLGHLLKEQIAAVLRIRLQNPVAFKLLCVW